MGYVIMDNHVHLLIQPSPGKYLSDIVCNFKKWTSRHNRSKPMDGELWNADMTIILSA